MKPRSSSVERCQHIAEVGASISFPRVPNSFPPYAEARQMPRPGKHRSHLPAHWMCAADMPRCLARTLRNWHRRKAKRLGAIIEDQRKRLTELLQRAEHHEHRAKHWDLVANRCRR